MFKDNKRGNEDGMSGMLREQCGVNSGHGEKILVRAQGKFTNPSML